MKKETKKCIEFKDLNIWLKVGVVGGVLYLITFVLSFIAGFMAGALGIV